MTPPLTGDDVAILHAGAFEINRWQNENPGGSLNLHSATVRDSALQNAFLHSANLSNATFVNCNFSNAEFDRATLSNTTFDSCNLSKSSFRFTRTSTLTLRNCVLNGANFRGATGFSQILELHSSHVKEESSDVLFDLSLSRFQERFLSWDKIRTVGKLRLFLPSYIGLIASTFFILALGFINEGLSLTRDAASYLFDRAIINAKVYLKLIEILQPLEASWRHAAVLISTLCIATASTLYLICPPTITAFTLEQWKYDAKQPSFHYYVSSWSHPRVRIWCAFFYCAGATIAALSLSESLVRAAKVMIKNLPLS